MKKILLCSEDEMVRETLKEIICLQYELIVVDSEEQSFHVLENAKDITIVIIDINLTKNSGRQFQSQLKTNFPKLKIIQITGFKAAGSKSKAIESKASGQISKPFKEEEILKAIKNC